MACDNEWCCDTVREKFETRNERGWFMFSEPPCPPVTDEPSFWLCFRSFAVEDAEKLKNDLQNSTVPIMLATWLPIHFCPSCGANMLRFYGSQFHRLYDQQISKEHGWIQGASASE